MERASQVEAMGVRDPGACSALSTSQTFGVSYSVATPTTFHSHFTSKWGDCSPVFPEPTQGCGELAGLGRRLPRGGTFGGVSVQGLLPLGLCPINVCVHVLEE